MTLCAQWLCICTGNPPQIFRRLPGGGAVASVCPKPTEDSMSSIETRLAELGVTLPDAPAPAANYVPFVVTGNIVHVSGQISQDAGGLIKGRLGADMDVAAGAAAAQRCAISLLAQLRNAVRRRLVAGRACRETDGLRQFDGRLHRSAKGDQRRVGLHRGGYGRCRAPRTIGRVCSQPAAWRGGRDRGHLRDPSVTTARPAARCLPERPHRSPRAA